MGYLAQLIIAIENEPKWYSVVGLTLDAIGALVIVYGVFISKRKVGALIKDAKPYYSEKPNEQSPSIRDRILQSRFAKVGAVLLFVGFVLQIIGNWPR